jgi:glycosyltransferase involved in cell wall biosynthesis
MKILKCHNYYLHHGGEDAIFEDETALLREHGHHVVQITEYNERADSMSLPSVAARSVWSFPAYRTFVHMLNTSPPDVVHFHNLFYRLSPSVYRACIKAGIAVTQTLLNYRLLCPASTLYRDGGVCEECLPGRHKAPSIRHGCYSNSRAKTAVIAVMTNVQQTWAVKHSAVDVFITATEFSRQKHISGGVPSERVVVKPNFIYRDPGKRDREDGYMVFVGRLVHEKGILTLLQTWRRLSGIPLKIIGEGPLSQEIRRADIPGIQVLGQIERQKCIAILRHARCLILPSEWYEVLPLAIVEAFACGVPVITSNLGTMAEVVKHGMTGLLFRPGNAQDLASQVLWANEHPREMNIMGDHARREYEDKYSAAQSYGALINIYQLAIDRHAKRTSGRIPS